ncbi:hypothetical protein ACFWMR_10350 [Amycolatopsis thailandensis]|uniref:hypothetical protein n=1 Tax=Amycolatopsis thailandensis TaxID=589330 RepID=UPI003652D80C
MQSAIVPADPFTLAPEENLLWQGAPKHIRIARKQDLTIVPFLATPLYFLDSAVDQALQRVW